MDRRRSWSWPEACTKRRSQPERPPPKRTAPAKPEPVKDETHGDKLMGRLLVQQVEREGKTPKSRCMLIIQAWSGVKPSDMASAIKQTLKLANGNREETARILGIGARTLYRKLDKYGLQ